jgi:hypothetical protein
MNKTRVFNKQPLHVSRNHSENISQHTFEIFLKSIWRGTNSAVPNWYLLDEKPLLPSQTQRTRLSRCLLMQCSTWMGNVRERKSTQQATYVTAAASNVLSSHSYIPFIMDRSCHFLPLSLNAYIQHTGCCANVLTNSKHLHHYIYHYYIKNITSIFLMPTYFVSVEYTLQVKNYKHGPIAHRVGLYMNVGVAPPGNKQAVTYVREDVPSAPCYTHGWHKPPPPPKKNYVWTPTQ